MARNDIARFGASAFMAVGLCAVACSDSAELPRGQLIIAFSTDMSVPNDLDEVRVQVFRSDGTALPDRQIPIIPAEDAPFGKPLPGTLALVPADAGGQQLRIVVTARREEDGVKASRVVREAIVKIPTDRSALLPMPLRWLCSGVVKPVEGSDDSFRSDCAEDETCVAGRCQPADVDADALPDYTPAAVFGGGDEAGQNSVCLDVQACFASTAILTPDSEDCSVPLPSGADADSVNVALVLDPETDGHCVDKGNCYLPLDADPSEGFRVARSKITLPRVACERQGVLGVAVSTSCPTKDLSVPVCGPWTGWERRPTQGTGGGSSMSGGGMSSGGTSSGGQAGAGASSGTAGTAGTVSVGGRAGMGGAAGKAGSANTGSGGAASAGGESPSAGGAPPIGGAGSGGKGGMPSGGQAVGGVGGLVGGAGGEAGDVGSPSPGAGGAP